MKAGTYWWCIARFLAIGFVLVLSAPEKARAQPSCGTIVDPPIAVVFAVEAAGLDVTATLSWNGGIELPPDAELVVRDADCDIVGAIEIVPEPNVLLMETVVDALRKVSKNGLKYQVTVEVERQEVLSQPFYFQVGLDCSADEVCAFSLAGGIFSDGIFLTGELDRALDEVFVEDSGDVLGTVIEQRPDLRSEVYALAAQLSHLDKQIHFSRPKGCHCVWTTPVDRPRQGLVHQIGMDTELKAITGLNILGGPLYLGARTSAGPVFHDTEQRTTAGAKLRCQEIDSWIPTHLEIAPTATLKFRFPVFRSCETLCGGEVVHDIHFELEMKALTAGEVSGALGWAAEFVEYSVDGTPILSSAYAVAASSDPGFPPCDDLMVVISHNQSAIEPSSARLFLQSGISAVAEGPTFAFADLANTYTMKVHAEASCGVVPKVTLTVGNQLKSGGVRIDMTPPPDL